MKPIGKLFVWLDDHLLEWAAALLLVFIPLYPKWPLLEVLPGYIVRLRLEDLVIAAVVLIWMIALVRKKIKLTDNPLFFPIALYLIIGFLSSLSALFVTKTVPLEGIHVAKLFLHWGRRVEYMALALVFFSAVRTKSQIRHLVTILGCVAVLLSVYGLGQKYLQWPVYSTMNREFAKGWRLVLTEHARVPSTFAGHYDFAAYSVIVLALAVGLLLYAKNAHVSRAMAFVFLAAFLSLLLTASRASFIAYFVAISSIAFLFSRRHGWRWALLRWTPLVAVSIIGMLTFGDLSQRFAHLVKIDQLREFASYQLEKRLGRGVPRQVPLSDDLALVYTETDQPPLPLPTIGELPPDVFENIPEAFPQVTESGIANATIAGKPRTYSPAAFTFGLSSAIRFDALWPRAIKGFLTNPLLGTGYSTLVKTQVSEFTEAESTDNDFLRALGETGILGFLSFFGILAYVLWVIWKRLSRVKDPLIYALMVGIGGATIGLLVNALYIDVFEASKVAYTFWAMLGILFASLRIYDKKLKVDNNEQRK